MAAEVVIQSSDSEFGDRWSLMCNLNLALGSNPFINQHQMTCEEAVIVEFRAAHLCC